MQYLRRSLCEMQCLYPVHAHACFWRRCCTAMWCLMSKPFWELNFLWVQCFSYNFFMKMYCFNEWNEQENTRISWLQATTSSSEALGTKRGKTWLQGDKRPVRSKAACNSVVTAGRHHEQSCWAEETKKWLKAQRERVARPNCQCETLQFCMIKSEYLRDKFFISDNNGILN